VERTCETVETGGEGKHRRAQSTANQVGGVGRNVTTLVVGVNGEVKSHELNKVGVLGEAKLVGEVVGVVLVLLDSRNLAILVDISVDAGGNAGELCNEVHGVLKVVLPVLGLLDTSGVCLSESGLTLESGHSEGELSHGVEIAGAAVDKLVDIGGNVGAGSPFSREVADLLLRRNLAGEKEPEKTFGEGLVATRSLRELLLTFRDLIWYEHR
jgi:hypothetical protein